MKNIRIRFITYFTAGLFLFLFYFIAMFTLLLGVINPEAMATFSVEVDFYSLIIFAFCFLTGGTIFSFLLVQPISRIITSISELSDNNYASTSKSFANDGKLKWYYFLYKEVIVNIKTLGNALQQNAVDREKIESAKNDWLAGISHDLKTPLSYINGYTSLLLNEKHYFSESERRAYLKEIYEKGFYIEELINDMNHSFFWDSTGNLELKYSQIDIVSFLQNVLADVASSPKAVNNQFAFQSESEHTERMIDEGLMNRAIHNLLMNCIDHNPSDTKIEVSLKRTAKGVCIEIVDNGIGMNEETTVHIFDKYFSKKDKHAENKGLGMYIAKQIIEAHKGKISIFSAEGMGTTVQILME